MPTIPHPRCNAPEDDETIWRYIPESRLQTFLDGNLWLSRANNPGFNDQFEYSLPKIWTESESELFRTRVVGCLQSQKSKFFLSCWNAGDNESEPMWSEFADDHRGVAIRSSVLRLKKSVEIAPLDLYLSRVTYAPIEFSWTGIPQNVFDPIIRKIPKWSAENEIRLIAHEGLSYYPNWTPKNIPEADKGFSIPVDFASLCEAIVLGRAVGSDTAARIQTALVDAGFHNVPVESSKLLSN